MNQRHRIAALFTISAAIAALSAQGAVIFNDQQNATHTAFDGNASATDLINAGAATLASSTLAANSFGWSPAGINNGVAIDTTGDTSLYAADSGPTLPAQSTFNLDISANTLGYSITSIVSIAGWNHGSIPYGNQRFTVEFSTVGDAGYTTLFADHDLSPFGGTGATMVTVTDDTGVLAIGVDSLRVTYNDAAVGSRTIVRELDIFGTATVPEPSSLLLAVLGSVGILAVRSRRTRRSA